MITMIELPGFGEDREMADLRARIEKAEADLTTERTRVRLHGESLDKMRAQRDALAERVKPLEATIEKVREALAVALPWLRRAAMGANPAVEDALWAQVRRCEVALLPTDTTTESEGER